MTAVTDTWVDPTSATIDKATGDVYTETVHDAIVGNELFLYKRRIVELTNKSGGSVAAGDVVVLDTTTDSSFTTTTTIANPLALGVAYETIANNASGKIIIGGLASVSVDATTARGDIIVTGTTAKSGKPLTGGAAGVYFPGVFAVAAAARTGSGTVTCLLLGPPHGAHVTVIDRDLSVNEVVATTTETTVYTYTVPGGLLGSTRGLRLTMVGDYLNNGSGVSDLTMRVKLGGTLLGGVYAQNQPVDTVRAGVALTAVIHAAGATNAQRASVVAAVSTVGTGFATAGNPSTITVGGSGPRWVDVNNALGLDCTTDQALIITAQHSLNHANTSFKCLTAMLELLP